MNLYNREYSEKRDYIRMKIQSPIEVTHVATQVNHIGTCIDLSGGGMLLNLDQAIDQGEELLVTVSTSFGHQPMLSARCQVARCQQSSNDQFLLGLEIVELFDNSNNESTETL